MISIIDYGVVNIGSIKNMLKRIGAKVEVVTSEDQILTAEKIILPGVGAFDAGMTALQDLGFVKPLQQRVLMDQIPILGICLGMQLLGQGSEEGEQKGLCFVDGYCKKFDFDQSIIKHKIPHMGWNRLKSKDSTLFDDLDDRSRFYFVHSYHMICREQSTILATSEYGIEFTAMIQEGNVYGTQFHPEKSHRYGMTLLNNFVKM
jgi:imidazole glycerol-phosphate synthase subunit HisH